MRFTAGEGEGVCEGVRMRGAERLGVCVFVAEDDAMLALLGEDENVREDAIVEVLMADVREAALVPEVVLKDVPVLLGIRVRVFADVILAVVEVVAVPEDVLLSKALRDKVQLSVAVSLAEALRVPVCDEEGEPVPEGVAVSVLVLEEVGVFDGLAVLVGEELSVLL